MTQPTRPDSRPPARKDGLRIAWISAVQPPYREPMWRELATLAQLEVSFLFREEKTRHFVWRDCPDYDSSVVRTRRVPLPRSITRAFDEPVAVLSPGVTRRMLRGADALIIHVWWQPANVWAALRARIRRIPYLIYAESTLTSRQFAKGLPARLRSLIFRNAGAVLVPGPAAAEAAIADGAPQWRVVESPNTVDLDLFDRHVREIRNGDDSAGPHRFVCIGQLIERKNVGALVRAFAELDGDATLDIAGDGVQMAMLTSLAAELGIADRVRFHGFLQPAATLELLARTHTLVLPSTEEVYGYTALEAYVAGLQIIVSGRAGIAPNLADRPGTWVVEPEVADLRRALDDAQSAWTGWRDGEDLDFASPRRAARDVLKAIEIARTR